MPGWTLDDVRALRAPEYEALLEWVAERQEE